MLVSNRLEDASLKDGAAVFGEKKEETEEAVLESVQLLLDGTRGGTVRFSTSPPMKSALSPEKRGSTFSATSSARRITWRTAWPSSYAVIRSGEKEPAGGRGICQRYGASEARTEPAGSWLRQRRVPLLRAACPVGTNKQEGASRRKTTGGVQIHLKSILLGNEAFAEGAYESGVRVVSAYPGTPSTEITERLARHDDVHAEWAPNEKVALEVAIGASYGGVRALCCMKHVGLNVAADPLFTAAYTGVLGGLAVIVADDPGMYSSQNEQDSRFYARSAHVPMLEPADSQEAHDYVAAAYKLSEHFDTPVLVRSTTRLSHSRSIVETGERNEPERLPYQRDPGKYVMMPANARGRHEAVEARMQALAEYADMTPLNRTEMRDSRVGVVTSGVCYQYVREALPEASVLKLGMVHPLPRQKITDFAQSVDTLLVVEELEPFIEDQIRSWGIACEGKAHLGRQGEYSVHRLRERLFGVRPCAATTDGVLPRPPMLCAGCPHRGVFHTLGRLGARVMGDIGCYTLGALEPLNALDTTLCMGASIGLAHGMEKADPEAARNVVAVIGDSTFLHSGITSLLNMVYNGATSTVVILDNSTTGMTGHQDHPGTGRNAKGEAAPQVDLEALIRALGVDNVAVADPYDLGALERALTGAMEDEHLAVVIARRACALLGRDKPAPYCVTRACRSCGRCLNLGCPAISRREHGAVIAASQCMGCGICAQVCPFDAIVEDEI